MLLDVGSLAAMGVALGAALGVASHYLAVEEDPLENELKDMLPGSQCGQCGYVGCSQYAAALAHEHASVNLCIPGGKGTAEALAKRLGVSADFEEHEDTGPRYAVVDEEFCIGCLRCIGECTSDAIVGAPKQMHTVMVDNCHGCAKCFKICPTEAIKMCKVPVTLGSWHWQKPDVAAGGHAAEHVH
jgi:electron transport complex protein RnfB